MDYWFYLDNRSQLAGSMLEGPEPSPDTFADGTYPLARPIYVYTDWGLLGRTEGGFEILRNLQSLRLLSVLQVQGFTAVDDGKYVRIVPDANARQLAIPVLTGDGAYANAEYVTRVISVKNVPAMMLVPLLRPLLPQQSHMVAMPCTNRLILVDTYANVKRLEKIVSTLDTGEPYKPEKCGAPPAAKAD